jgi:hypothetical protein
MKSKSFDHIRSGDSFLHVVSEEAVGLYRDWWEMRSAGFWGIGATYQYT